jgi:hypothetical protein
VLALKMVTPPATRAAMPSTRMNTIRSCARTERPNHRASSARARHDAGAPAAAVESGARIALVLDPLRRAEHRRSERRAPSADRRSEHSRPEPRWETRHSGAGRQAGTRNPDSLRVRTLTKKAGYRVRAVARPGMTDSMSRSDQVSLGLACVLAVLYDWSWSRAAETRRCLRGRTRERTRMGGNT